MHLPRFFVPLLHRSLYSHPPTAVPVYSRSIKTKANSALTAACCVIGDEILSGKTHEGNANYLAKVLFDLGVDLRRIEVVPDEESPIIDTIRRLSNTHDIVFTSGGIGPTHDDITYSALAKAFDLCLELDPLTCQQMEEYGKSLQGWILNDSRKRMALFPSPATLLRPAPELWVPVVVVNKNVHILPGVPSIFQTLVQSLAPHILGLAEQKTGVSGSTRHYYRLQIETSQREGDIAAYLAMLQERVKEQGIKIGSYPKWGSSSGGTSVVVSIVGIDKEALQALQKEIHKKIGKDT
ncbi:MoaB/Mog domain-containing protein [Spinellus fusiger]|nr:MoaB/Mog domain-containing protein [Spinellus fusiger]